MSASSYYHIAASAFRIYLIHILHQTEELLSEIKFRTAIISPAIFQESDDTYDNVFVTAHRVITYIKNCQNDDAMYGFFSRGIYGLCAIEAAQDALRYSVMDARAKRFGGSGKYLPRLSMLSAEHTSRATCISNAIVALNTRKDPTLASLWIEAAQYIYNHKETKRDDDSETKCRLLVARGYFTKASAIETEVSTQHSSSTELTEICRLAACNYRRAAAHHMIYGSTKKEFKAAAVAYENASKLCLESLRQNTTVSSKLWRIAVSTMRLAADMIAAHEQDAMLVDQTICTVKDFAMDARHVPKLISDCGIVRAALVKASADLLTCTNMTLLPLLQVLKATLQKQCDQSERYLLKVIEGEGRKAATLELLSAGVDIEQLTQIKDTVRRVDSSIQSAKYFRTKAQQSSSAHHVHLRALLKQCWTLAAQHMENAVLVYRDSVVDGVYFPLPKATLEKQRARYESVDRALYLAESVLGHAVSHLDSARCAEVSGRDPREALYWRRAADNLVQAAEHMCSAIQDDFESLSSDYKSVSELTQAKSSMEAKYITAADYMYRSHLYLHQESMNQHPHAARISALYEQMAELLTNQSIDTSLVSVIQSALHCFTQYIEELKKCDICAKQIALKERRCLYVYECSKAVLKDKRCADNWKHAYNSIGDAVKEFGNSDKSNILSAKAALHACAAVAMSNRKLEKCMMYEKAGEVIVAAIEAHGHSTVMTAYRITLAARILTCTADSFKGYPVPEELLVLLIDSAEVEFQGNISNHARAYRLHAKCSSRSAKAKRNGDEVAHTAWSEAMTQTAQLADSYQYAQDCVQSHSNYIAAQELTVRCYIAAAEAIGDFELSQAWGAAVKKCQAIAEVAPHRFIKRKKCMKSTEVLVAAAETLQATRRVRTRSSTPSESTESEMEELPDEETAMSVTV